MDAQNLKACFVLNVRRLTVKVWKSRQPYWFCTPGWSQFGRLEIIVRSK